MHFGITVIVTTSSAMHFDTRLKWWGTCATGVQKNSKDLIGQLGQVVGKARCLTVFTELPLAGAQRSNPKELCIEQYACAENDVPVCSCKDSRESFLTMLRTTVAQHVANAADQEQQDCHSILSDIQDGAGHPPGNIFSLGVQLPHQRVGIRYFDCSRKTHGPLLAVVASLLSFLTKSLELDSNMVHSNKSAGFLCTWYDDCLFSSLQYQSLTRSTLIHYSNDVLTT